MLPADRTSHETISLGNVRAISLSGGIPSLSTCKLPIYDNSIGLYD